VIFLLYYLFLLLLLHIIIKSILLLRVFFKVIKVIIIFFFFLIQLFNATGTYQTYYHLFIIQSFLIISFFQNRYWNYYHLFFCYPLFFIIPYCYKKLSKLLSSLLLFTLFNYFFSKNWYWNYYHLFFCYPLFLIFSCQNHKGVSKFFFTVEVPAQLACY